MLVLLDTTVLIDFMRGRPAADRVDFMRSRGDRPCTSTINVEEVVRGLLPHEQDAARAMLSGLRILPLRRDEGWRAGEWRREFAARGISLSQADCLVAAAALTNNAVLATGNPRDFPMTEVTVDDWPVGA